MYDFAPAGDLYAAFIRMRHAGVRAPLFTLGAARRGRHVSPSGGGHLCLKRVGRSAKGHSLHVRHACLAARGMLLERQLRGVSGCGCRLLRQRTRVRASLRALCYPHLFMLLPVAAKQRRTKAWHSGVPVLPAMVTQRISQLLAGDANGLPNNTLYGVLRARRHHGKQATKA